MKVIEYKTVYGSTIIGINDEVNKHLKKGYELWGNPFIDKEDYIYQAMVKWEKEEC